MASFALDFSTCPELIVASTEANWQAIEAVLSDEQQAQIRAHLAQFPQRRESLSRCIACSDFVADWARRHPQALVELLADEHLESVQTLADYRRQLRARLASCDDEASLAIALRQFRNRAQVGVIWRDFNCLATMSETVADLSALAEVCIDEALAFVYPLACDKWGTPQPYPALDAEGIDGCEQQAPPLIVLGMGKLGAGELNLSSDIDLIFVYPDSGETQPNSKGRTVSHQKFFTRLGQMLIKALDEMRAEGFVFRVDMRLRPYGQSGALALSFAAFEEYYQSQGRDWERYAMIKARVVGGDRQLGAELLQTLRPFVYRRYLDFSAIEALREMKAMIRREVKRRSLHANVKLGEGGIREVEFIAQAFQLIHGGRDVALQTPCLQPVLQRLAERQLLPEMVVQSVWQSYEFLRNVEHGIQGYRDCQTQELPVDEADRARLAYCLGFADWSAFSAQLQQHRDVVSDAFEGLVAPAESEESTSGSGEWVEVWLDQPWELEELSQRLTVLQMPQSNEVAEILLQLHEEVQNKGLHSEGAARLDRFMPMLLARLVEVDNAAETLLRVTAIIRSVVRRSAYLLLLIENPNALQQLLVLTSASPWIAEQLAKFPLLLDELLDAKRLFSPPDRQDLSHQLQQEMLRIPQDDLEEQMESLRRFKMVHVLRVAAAETAGALPLMKVSDYLTYIAEVILEYVVDLAWQQQVVKYGYPMEKPGVACDTGFAIVGYGKLGGIEFGYASDLDIVFLHNGSPTLSTNGERSIDNQVFFTRLGQRIIHILNTQTRLGALYEVDMRLRPSGASGMLVSSVTGFEKYQYKQAWTWEHQALVRARKVAGCPQVGQLFEEVRDQVLRQSRDSGDLQQEVCSMREKMREALGTAADAGKEDKLPALFHLKQDAGGIVDIEFVVQYAVLAWAHKHPELTRFTDNVRILQQLAELGLIEGDAAEQLTQAYLQYRSRGHSLALQQQPGKVGVEHFVEQRTQVQQWWQQLMTQS